MPYILHIETATKTCSLALSKAGKLIGLKESRSANSHSALLSTFMQELMCEANLQYTQLDAIAVSMGPGSYTGLRIGVSSAKGLCYALDKPLIAVNTLQSIACGLASIHSDTEKNALFCPMIDARRMEVYTALFDSNNNIISDTEAKIIDENSFASYLKKHIIYFGGDGSQKCKNILAKQAGARFLDDFEISAEHMINIANKKYSRKAFENVAYFEPFYLKDFIAGKPRVKGLE